MGYLTIIQSSYYIHGPLIFAALAQIKGVSISGGYKSSTTREMFRLLPANLHYACAELAERADVDLPLPDLGRVHAPAAAAADDSDDDDDDDDDSDAGNRRDGIHLDWLVVGRIQSSQSDRVGSARLNCDSDDTKQTSSTNASTLLRRAVQSSLYRVFTRNA